MDRDLPEGVIDANPPGGWEPVDDGTSTEQDDEAQGSPELADDPPAPDDPIAGEAVRQGADPDLGVDRGEEP
ncbi:hypothetical protein QL996_06935 [Planococcus sp. APC 4015]|nr:hypothetical protein [Planococcus sp. APC 4015]